MKQKRALHCNVMSSSQSCPKNTKTATDLATVWQMAGMWRRREKAGHVNWNGIHSYTHAHTHTHTWIHTRMLVYINRYSVKTAGTVTLGSYKVHLSIQNLTCGRCLKKQTNLEVCHRINSKWIILKLLSIPLKSNKFTEYERVGRDLFIIYVNTCCCRPEQTGCTFQGYHQGAAGDNNALRRRRFFDALQFSSWVMHYLSVTIFGEFTWTLVKKKGKALIWQYILSTLQQYRQFEPPSSRAFLWGDRARGTRVCQTVEARGGGRRENQTVQSGGRFPPCCGSSRCLCTH